MQTTSLHDAKTHLSHLIDRAGQGEDIIICKYGKPVAMLVKYQKAKQSRIPGQWTGKVRMSSDFDVLPDEFMAYFK